VTDEIVRLEAAARPDAASPATEKNGASK